MQTAHFTRVHLFVVIAVLATSAICPAADESRNLSEKQQSTTTSVEPDQAKLELVMSLGMRITAQTSSAQMLITAGEDLKRSYTWEGATRSATLWPRHERWYGSLGAYYPGPGDHWEPHHGITRGVVQEGQQHFRSVEDALEWLESQARHSTNVTYRNDGLVVLWGTYLPRRQLNVDVWQILINGRRPLALPGANDDSVRVSRSTMPGRAKVSQ